MPIREILKRLMLLPAPSGYEQAVVDVLLAEWQLLAAETRVDTVGNVLARFPGTDPAAPVIMVYAHMDQLGFIVRQIEPDGYLRFERLGGIPEKVLPSLSVQVLTSAGTVVDGVIGNKSHHVTPAAEKYQVDPIGDLFVDIGAASRAEVLALGVNIGSPAVYRPSCQELAGGRICGTSIDNRGGLAALILLAQALWQRPARSTVWLVGTVWEEFNLRGAALAARAIQPKIAIALDVVLTGDTPDLRGRFDVRVGGGPAVMLYNFHGRGTLNGTIPQAGLVRLAEQAAKAQNLPLQRFAGVGLLTDSAYVQLEHTGVAAIELGFPARYTHTPAEVCDPGDITQLASLTEALIQSIDASFDTRRLVSKLS
jgi:putative aminopeptidase FrvX